MKERIKEIMEAENLTPSLFADKLNVGRAVISHILNGRNNPSLDVVTRILETMTYIDADWLLSGKGNMRRITNTEVNSGPINPGSENKPINSDLFDNKPIEDEERGTMPSSDTPVSPIGDSTTEAIPKTHLIPNIESTKKINKIIIYYSDNTFDAFNPDKSPF